MGERLEKFRKGANDKRYYFFWLIPTVGVMYWAWRGVLRAFDPTSGLFDIGIMETPFAVLLYITSFIMFSLILMNFSFKHLIDFYLNRARETFSSLNPLHKCVIFISVFFLFFYAFVYLAGKMMS